VQRDNNYTVSVGLDHVTVTKNNQRPRVARILARDPHPEAGLQVLFLDRLVCPPGGLPLNPEWSASGCISTILTGPADTATTA
jgi:hypothetical protein